VLENLTFILMFVILGSGLDRRTYWLLGLAIGLTVGLEAYGTNYRGKYESNKVVWSSFCRRNLAAPLGLLVAPILEAQ